MKLFAEELLRSKKYLNIFACSDEVCKELEENVLNPLCPLPKQSPENHCIQLAGMLSTHRPNRQQQKHYLTFNNR